MRRPVIILAAILAACVDPNGVTPPPAVVSGIDLAQPSFLLTVGQSIVVVAAIRTSNGHGVAGQVIDWSTTDTTIATVGRTGTLTAVSPGTTTLQARIGAVVSTAPVTVRTPPNEPVTFVMTGSMTTARSWHAATLLLDHTVLITGGSDDRPLSAELYDPTTRTFTPTGNMTTARVYHTATLLPDGRVLIVGGDLLASGQEGPSRSTAELYDPVSKTFARTGDLVTPQFAHTAALLGNGKVLISGGLTTICCPSAVVRAEVYDPSTGKFAVTGAYAGQGSAHLVDGGPAIPTATVLRSGTVLIAGEPVAELYDPNTGAFSLTGAMVTPGRPYYIAGRTATRLLDGMVLLTGGEHEDIGRFAEAELYDPSSGVFSLIGDMAFPRQGHSASLLPNGNVLIAGGESVGQGCLGSCAILSVASAELYDATRRTFTSAGSMNVRREHHTATVLNDGTVLLAGGDTFDGGLGSGFTDVAQASAEIYGARAASANRAPIKKSVTQR